MAGRSPHKIAINKHPGLKEEWADDVREYVTDSELPNLTRLTRAELMALVSAFQDAERREPKS